MGISRLSTYEAHGKGYFRISHRIIKMNGGNSTNESTHYI